jgi:hypothetical protein
VANTYQPKTSDRILRASSKNPFALGPILGRMLLSVNMSPATAAETLGIYEATLYRWMYDLGSISPKHLMSVARLLAILSWILTKRAPLKGSVEFRNEQFKTYVKQFRSAQDI